MDDIFSDPKDDAEKEGDSNIEWKKSGIDKHERLTLKINVREANLYNAAKANDLNRRTLLMFSFCCKIFFSSSLRARISELSRISSKTGTRI